MQGVYADVHLKATSKENILYPMSDDRVQYAELNHSEMNKSVTKAYVDDSEPGYYCKFYSYYSKPNQIIIIITDKLINLDNLLIQLRDEVTPHWQKFGMIIGVPKDIIVKCSEYPPDQCIIEILDHWLRHHKDGPLTWRDVAEVLRQINLSQLSENILKVYETGMRKHYM